MKPKPPLLAKSPPRFVDGRNIEFDDRRRLRSQCTPMRVSYSFLVVAVVITAAACAQGSDPGATPTTQLAKPSSSPRTTVVTAGSLTTALPKPTGTSAQSTVDPVVAGAYQQAVRSEFDASSNSDANLPMLAATHLDPLLQRLKDRLIGRRLEGQAAKRPEATKSVTTIVSTKVEGDKAVLGECTVDDATVYVVASGAVVNDKVATMRRTATLLKDGELWKVADRVNEQEWEGVAGCANS